MALRLAEVGVGQWSLGDERPQAVIFGFVGQLLALLVDHGQLVTQGAQARRDLFQPPFDQETWHNRQCRDGVSQPGPAT